MHNSHNTQLESTYHPERLSATDTTAHMMNEVYQDRSIVDYSYLSKVDDTAQLISNKTLPVCELYDGNTTDVTTFTTTQRIGIVDEAKIAGTTVGNDSMKPIVLGQSTDSVTLSQTDMTLSSTPYASLSSLTHLTPEERLALALSGEVVKGVGNAFKEAWFGTPETEEQAASRYAAEQAEVRANEAESLRRDEESRLYYQREEQQRMAS